MEPSSTPAQIAVSAARAAPQSRRKAMLAVLLLDAAVDEAFVRSGESDVLEFRARLATTHRELGLVMEVAAMREGGPRLVLEPVEVAVADTPALGVEDYMVSLYNDRTVPRVLVAPADGGRRDVHALLAAAMDELLRL
ncbi:MAG: hypothetical protein ABI697_09995 [Devosia sp.]